jgi:hypothetical protein
MKIEAAKNYQADKKDSNIFQTEASLFDTSAQVKPNDSAPAPTPGAFAKILDEARKQEDKDKNNSTSSKNSSAEKNSKSSKTGDDSKINRANDEKKELEERNGKNGNDRDGQPNDNENQLSAIALGTLQSDKKSLTETTGPAARQILHIADLERIISTIRTENFQHEKQVTIALKNSILEGLQIKLTVTENGKLKAEFLALNEQIKKQLNVRKKELSEILRNRSGLFSEIEITDQKTAEKG